MNKTDLTSKIAEKTGLTKVQAEAALKAFTDIVAQSLAEGDKVQVTGFGVFETRKHAPRTGRDLNTGKEIEIPEKTFVSFHAGSQLKATVTK